MKDGSYANFKGQGLKEVCEVSIVKIYVTQSFNWPWKIQKCNFFFLPIWRLIQQQQIARTARITRSNKRKKGKEKFCHVNGSWYSRIDTYMVTRRIQFLDLLHDSKVDGACLERVDQLNWSLNYKSLMLFSFCYWFFK